MPAPGALKSGGTQSEEALKLRRRSEEAGLVVGSEIDLTNKHNKKSESPETLDRLPPSRPSATCFF